PLHVQRRRRRDEEQRGARSSPRLRQAGHVRMSAAGRDGVLRAHFLRRVPQGGRRFTTEHCLSCLSRSPGSTMRVASAPAVLILGVLYVLAGIVFGELAGQAASHQMRVAWRWAAWVVSAIAFGAHTVYEQVRLCN